MSDPNNISPLKPTPHRLRLSDLVDMARLHDQPDYTLKQLSAISGLGLSTIYVAVHNQKLRATKPAGRVTVVKAEDARAFIDSVPAFLPRPRHSC